jgi:putative hydrolase of the HAD superfamily
MIRGIIFDFGGVLMRTEDQGPRKTWEARLNLPGGALEQAVHQSDLWIEAQCGRLNMEAYWQGVAERLNISAQDLPALQRDYFAGDVLDQSLMALIKRLRAEGYSVALLSNDAASLVGKLRDELGIYTAFDAVVISAEIGVMKPDVAAYRVAAEALGLSLPECIFIDDNTANVDGALACGLPSIFYRAGMDVAAAIQERMANTPKTRVMLFDNGNVMDIPIDRTAWLAHRDALATAYGISGENLRLALYYSEAWGRVKVGHIPFDQYLDEALAPYGVTDPAAQHALWEGYHRWREHIHPEVLEMLWALKAKGHCMAVLSNAYQLDMRRWFAEKRGVPDLFDAVFSSAQMGVAKPDPEIYRQVLAALNCQPSEILFVDDLTRNTTIAEAMGIPCVVFESPLQLRQALMRRGLLP